MSRKQSNYKPTLLDICVLTAGRVDLFKKCIENILPQVRDEYCLYVFNNGAPSQEYEDVYKLLPSKAKVKRNNVMTGFGDGANNVIKMGKSPLVLFISDDVFLAPDTIDILLRRLDNPQIALCGLKLTFPDDSTDPTRPAGRVQHVGHAINVRGEVIHPLMGWRADNPRCNVSQEVQSVTGAVFMVRRVAFQRAGGFSPIYGKGYFEDVDLCLTLRTMGYKIYIDTDAKAVHGVAQTFQTAKLDSPPNLAQNQLIFRTRHATHIEWDDWKWY